MKEGNKYLRSSQNTEIQSQIPMRPMGLGFKRFKNEGNYKVRGKRKNENYLMERRAKIIII